MEPLLFCFTLTPCLSMSHLQPNYMLTIHYYQRRTNIFQRRGAEVEGRLTGRGSGGRSPPDADDNMAVTLPQITIILL